ncbi:VWA domain-containing protein [Maribacter sp. MMG018]|uniref:VWA domain-containing protein n=1 Tax=Maribacter sp. MMG018 TaxID=2822688 RepID=UPI001B369419|nr:VWA domain-containing protein [Maribacter sp. MMG018]MBQ4915187.1 VWA domain-containing protein [Maribacter sp. MMG018]
MQTETVLLIILAALVAIGVSLFQYVFKKKKKGKLIYVLSFLRFLGVFSILLLIINPKFSKTTYSIEKPNLVLLVDNSSSVKQNDDELQAILSTFKSSENIMDRFNVETYTFGENLKSGDSLDYKEKFTDINRSLSALQEVYKRKKTAFVLISDGNQTIGRDYTFNPDNSKNPVYTITVGDTTRYEDVGIGNINTNKFAFLKNKYPLETYVTYQGEGSVSTNVSIRVNGKNVFTEKVNLSKSNNLKTIETTIDANSVGIKSIVVSVEALANEKNLINNTREATVEVIDEKTSIALISNVLHPDLGTLKKAIESNEQREVTILKPTATLKQLEEVDLFLLYEPTSTFNNIFEFISNRQSNYIVFTGVNTDYNYLNKVQNDFNIEIGYPVQEVFGTVNTVFSKFDITDFDITDFPPLYSDAGPLTINTSNEILINTEIRGVDINSPMLTVIDDNTWKKAIWTGSGIWKWRMQSYRNGGDFQNFDKFFGKLMRYMSGNSKRDRLNLQYSPLYEGSSTALISATYFDETFVFDPNASINIDVRNKETDKELTLPMILKNGYYEVDLTNLLPGAYTFKVYVGEENVSKTGNFVISDFDLEKQFISSDYRKMATLAQNTGGKNYFTANHVNLPEELSASDVFVPIQKSSENIVSLIDFRILLALIMSSFTIEWFIRKYNGLT